VMVKGQVLEQEFEMRSAQQSQSWTCAHCWHCFRFRFRFRIDWLRISVRLVEALVHETKSKRTASQRKRHMGLQQT
jgi:hypothetical protein